MSPDDEHCLLHSFITAYHNQLPLLHKPSLESITRGISDEINTNPEDYLAFWLSMSTLIQQMNDYIVYRVYNSDFGDLVPLILARVYCTNITILDTARSGLVTTHTVWPRVETSLSIAVQRKGDHYNGIVSKHIMPSTESLSTNIPHSPPVQCKASISNLYMNDPLPAPWSLDPLPLVTPVQLPDADTLSSVIQSNGHQRFSWARDELIMIKESATCHIDCLLRKKLMQLGIWGRHHGCGDNPGRGSYIKPKTINLRVTHRAG